MQDMLESFDLKKQADELGVSVWKSPGFLFILMGIIIISSMLAVYFVFNNPDSVEYLLFSEFALVLVLFTVGNSIISGVDEIARANKMKTEFVSIASHQLKTPLSEINWEMELLVSKFSEGLTEKQKELIGNVGNSNARMIRLVNDLLDVARIDQGRLPLVKEELDIVGIIKDVIDNNRNLAASHNVKVNVVNYGSVPKIFGDRKRTVVVLDNLISNSIKYTKEKGNVDVAITPEKDRLVVCVKDDGVGIPKKQQKNVFHKFFRSDNAIKNQTEGTGLGLYIAKNVIVQSGGDMWFDSEENRGSTFCFSLPLKKNDKFYSVSM
ncbi:MAG: Multi-sensor signal transduction histidine kinase [Candidatus Moranbacteria bacterium GW2011_GWE1_49_15]|nr:MAG: Multi-sensor signal transduction histidine kinase [Candidatus Moranbacteria bacterium GW2011_GWE2_47_10]KKW07399.1 MAG: Multi-sensor signal transduction histidine kinase [Candidatus Moranbacteria bacterium GW2011_GWE1_49_15]